MAELKNKQDQPADDPIAEVAGPNLGGNKGGLPSVCWSFLGLAVYRAWIEVAFVGSWVEYPSPLPVRNVYDIACLVTLLACAFFAKRLAPLFSRKRLVWFVAAVMALSSAAGFISIAVPEIASFIAVPAPLAAGASLAVVILLWSELYGCLNPVRIALYYAMSQLAGAAIIWTLKGFALPWLAVYTVILPFISMGMLLASFKKIQPEHMPRPQSAKFTFPWKPAALVCIYAFAFGLQEANTYAFTGPHSGPGMAIAAAIVVVGIVLLNRKVEFGTVYSVWLPALMMVSLVLSLVASFGEFTTSLFVGISYGAAEIFIMTMIGSICYRYGVTAVWIFGIERGVRLIAMVLGRAVGAAAPGIPVAALVIVGAAVGTWLIFSERDLSSDWGIVLYEEGEDLYQTALLNARSKACGELARTHGLTEREGEVLLLLANRKSASDIEHELCIANGTAKAHIRHVYRKLGVHAREDLFDMVDEAGKIK